MGKRPEFKHALLGVNPRKVMSRMRQLKHLQETEWLELQEKIKAQRLEQERLKAQWDELHARKRRQADAHQFQQLLMERARQVVLALQEQTRQELDELQEQIAQKEEAHRKKIEWIEQETESYNQALQALLQEFGAVMQKFSGSSLDLLEMLEQRASQQHESACEPDVRNKPHVLPGVEERLLAVAEAAADVEFTEAAPVPRRMASESSTFWGDIEALIGTAPLVEADVPDADMSDADVPDATMPETDANFEVNLDANENVSAVDSNQQGAEVTAEINSIRNRYIVGKIAGEDLFDHRGRLIVAKGETIDADMVEIAEREGKLPDLIVNMKIQGVSRDER